jgi:Mrp family chromosome partitioning ATPase/capsular polysaccharide biosynthesis protein
MGGATTHANHAATLRDYLQVVRRRKWIILQAVVLVPLAAVAFSLHQQTLYQAQAKVLLNAQNLASQLTGTAQYSGVSEPQTEIVQTQAEVARVPAIADRVLRSVRRTGLTAQTFLNRSGVSPSSNADLLTFSVTNHDSALAQRLVDAYAGAYTTYRRQLDTAAIATALRSLNARISQLVRSGDRRGSLYTTLVSRQETLATMEALQTSNASVVQQASNATRVQPKPTRNGILGLVLGIVLGLGLAFLWEALDTRVRSAHEIGEKLGGLPLLARIPEPSKQLRTQNRLAMVEDPAGVQAETFRMLRTNLDFVTLDRDARTLMVTSAVEQEGKSTTIANLAVALARAGHRVALVDLDLRRPFVARFFDVEGPGLTEVVLGHASLDEALAPIAIVDPGGERRPSNGNGRSNGNGHSNGNGNGHAYLTKGMLEVLASGPIPPDPGDFIGKQALSEILSQLRERFDFVLIDAPPVLHVGDAIALSTKVDGILVVTRMKLVRRQMLSELGRQLATVPTPVLGFILTGAGEEEGYGDGYGYGYAYHPHAYEQSERVETGRSFP